MKQLNFTFVVSIVVLCCGFITQSRAGESYIPLKDGVALASDDLIYEGRVLTSGDAERLRKNQGVDLSELSPRSNTLWSEQGTYVNDNKLIPIESSDLLSFEGTILSNTGLFRFNAIPVGRTGAASNKIFTIHLDKTLHTMLLRKNFLRALGYKIPAMKYLKEVKIQFASQQDLELFLKRDIPEATLGASDRWHVKRKTDSDRLIVTLRDVAITQPDESDFYNVSMGIPANVMNSRTLRSLAIPYSILDLYESVNKYSWVGGKIDNQAVVLNHFTDNQFTTTKDDAAWMLRRIARLTRIDIAKMVEEAAFPKEIQVVLVEKIISRRNYLNQLFDLGIAPIAFDSNVSYGNAVKEGKVIKLEYPDYASRFAYGDAESPMDQLRFYFYSKIQSNIINNVISKINEEFIYNQANKERQEYYTKQFKEGLDHFVKTGEFLPIEVGTWYSPFVNGQMILSRDIVIGNYLGTNNLVQLADTFGAGIDVGVMLGIEGLGHDLSSSARVTTSFVRTYSHIRPVKNLKESLKEPYRNMFVGLLKQTLKENFLSLSDLKKVNSDQGGQTPELKTKIDDLLSKIENELKVGESLILTDRIMPTAGIRLNFNQGLIDAGIGIQGGATVVKRIHIYKKASKQLQIYDDAGFVKSIDLSFHVSKYIPFLKLNAKYDSGKYNIKSYIVSLANDDSNNPNLAENALGIYNVLKNKNFELLNKNSPPTELDAEFKDKTKGLSFFWWKLKSVVSQAYYSVKAKNGVHGKYFSLERNRLSGVNPEAFAKQVMNYYIAQEIEDFQIAEEQGANPGDSVFGRAKAKRVRFEAALDEDGKFEQQFLSYSIENQGWAIKENRAKDFMLEINEKFKANIFNVDQIDFKKLRLFKMGYHFSIYDRGIGNVRSLPMKKLDEIEKRYRKEARCHVTDEDYDRLKCGSLGSIKSKHRSCARLVKKNRGEDEQAVCYTEMFERMFEDLKFDDLISILGKDNFYLYGSIDGLREKSEILNDTIYSNSVGTIGSKQWNGPIDVVRSMIGLSPGEFSGNWLREGF